MSRRILPLAAFAAIVAIVASAAPPTPCVTIGRCATPPVIDGKLDDACWTPDTSAILQHFVELDFSRRAEVKTTARICYDNTNLYVSVRCEEPEIEQLKTHVKKRDGGVWRDDCVELFLDPGRTRKGFHQIITNSCGTIFDRKLPGTPDWNSNAKVANEVGTDYWTAEFSIPLSALGGTPKSGAVWGFNIGRERYAGKGGLSAWSATLGKFDRVERYGTLVFADTPIFVTATLPDTLCFGPNTFPVKSYGTHGKPVAKIQRDWPPKLARTWTLPEAKVTGAGGDWRVTLPFVDGSETGFVIQLGDSARPASRICLPAAISPIPDIAALARQLLSLGKRSAAHPESALAKEAGALLKEVEDTVMSFVQSNLTRTKPMTQREWSAMASGQRRLSGRIAGLVYVLWTADPLAPFSRTDLPPGLRPDPGVELTACGNDTEAATFVLTNLDDQPLEGRFVLGDLEMAAGEFEGLGTQPNLIRNGDFSKDDNKDNIPDSWKKTSLKAAGFGIERDGAETAFALTGDASSSAVFRQAVPIKPGTRYTLRAVISTEKLPPAAGNLHIIRDGWTWAKSITARGPTTTRMVYTSSFTAPDAKYFQVVLRLVDANGGTIRYHDLKLVEGAIETATLQNTCIRLHEVAFQPLRLGKTVADPLPRMDGANRFHVPAGESRQFWLSVKTRDLPPGEYSTTLTATPLDRELPRKSAPLRLRVLPVRLPDRMPIGTFNWDYAKNEGQIRDLVEHRTTSFLVNTHFPMSFEDDGTMKSPADWGRYDVALVRKLHYARENGGMIIFSYGIVRDFDRRFRKRHGWKFMDEAWKKAFKSWVLEFERHLRDDLGMAHNEYTVQLWDEATHGNAELTVQAGMYMRSFAPEISTCMDGAQDPDEIRAMDPVIDFWIPHQSTLYGHARAKEIRALYKQIMAKGEPVWTYTCSTSMKALSPLDYYRLKEWRVWDLGMQGSCYWAYNSWRGDPWNDFDGTISDCGSIYDGPHGAITSRRWESTLDGREDYLCLHLLREAGRRARGAEQAKIEEFIAQSVKSVLEAPKDIELFRTVRSDLLAELARRVGTNPPSLKNPPSFTVTGDTLLCRLAPDRPISATLYYRVPGYDSWRSVSVAESATPLLTVRGLTRKRTIEWYLLFHDRTGASAAALDGLAKDGRIAIP